MEENLENYNQLIDRLKFGDRWTFRSDLEMLAQTFGSFRPLEDVAKISLEKKELLGVILELVRDYGQAGNLGLLSFHSLRRIGPQAIPYIREEWQRTFDARGIHYLHICLMDIIGASPNEVESQRLMSIIAEQEFPLWLGMLQGDHTASRGLVAWALGALARYAPSRAKQAGEAIISLLYDDNSSVQTSAVRGLIAIGDNSLLQDALFRLARAARDETPLELLVSQTGKIDVNAKDDRGKTALMYAEESGNKRIAEMLEKAGTNKSRLPKISDFPPGTEFVIKEFDVPLVWIPNRGWFNWFGGAPRSYDERFLRVDNNWLADSFEDWIKVVEESLS